MFYRRHVFIQTSIRNNLYVDFILVYKTFVSLWSNLWHVVFFLVYDWISTRLGPEIVFEMNTTIVPILTERCLEANYKFLELLIPFSLSYK